MLRLLHGDCLEVMRDLSDGSIDCFVCDLPYWCLHDGGVPKEDSYRRSQGFMKDGASTCAWDVKIDLKAFWTQVKRLAKNDHTPVLMFCTTKFGAELINSNPKWFRYDLVWDKGRGVSFLSANKMPLRSHEMVYVLSKAGAYYNRVDISGNFKQWYAKRDGTPSQLSTQYGVCRNTTSGGDGKRCVKSVIQVQGGNRKTNGHPTEKPEELYRWLIERYCPPGGTVLDPTAGSFNSVAAAHALGRNAIGIEKEEKFYKAAVARLNSTNSIVSSVE